ncbi:hypothetical protein BN14_10999 [Rhizoctonia solani AG-1 IB]|uniref:Transposase domain-containing protein n=1 Tax=Thanatephorus cucumeris (strain AG1-IB / isolate 7/3/14) TaxID=1108050 RepID=M5CGX0_THACB|nr:hypothetical protein BN14_10999 [Rhizoctonia solani AG-1 IB]
MEEDPFLPEPTIDLPENTHETNSPSPEQVLLPQNSSIRRNPPVTIEDWPEPELDPPESNEDEPIPDGPGNQDYAFEDDTNDDSDRALGFAELSDAEFHNLLRQALGDAFNDEVEQLYNQAISTDDVKIIKMLSAKIRAHFSRQAYNEIRDAFLEELGLPSEYVSWRRVRILSGLECQAYDCCINSCCAFLGKYKAYDTCPFCREARFNSRGKPRKVFHYTPLIPQLQVLYANLKLIELLQYRSQQDATFSPSKIRDIFDSKHYRSLLGKHLHPTSLKQLFDDIRDLALALSLDGFTLFKRRRKGNSTAWPLIIINYNLPPEIQTHFENVICVGVIPGPRQFKDLNSFLIPLLDELMELESGVTTRDHSAPRSE